ncbi:permease [Amycolatopsis taiwanensis]|uniref:Permease n=1 Tax=Amycolatopsis taiwanensis TaxID=342230 RepID=A0A9W6R8T1_9PSEU|nr:permease [Amycolatopsis taiwanensis]
MAPATGNPPAGTRSAANVVRYSLAALGLVGSAVLGAFVHAPTVWGLLPVVLYAVLSLSGMHLLLATACALVSGILLDHRSPARIGELLGHSLGDTVTLIGVIVVLGGALGEVLRVTGAADVLVRGVLRVIPGNSRIAIQFGVMLACLVLVFALGTLAGALAIVAPIVIPVVARAGFTRSATASMMFLGGCAGLALAPFAGSNIAILDAAKIGYGTYLLVGAGPLAVLSILLSLVVVPRVQRRSAAEGGDFYSPEQVEKPNEAPHSGRATVVFGIFLAATVAYAVVAGASTSFPLLALPVLAVVTAAAGGLSVPETVAALARGGGRLFETFLMFWLLAAFFQIVDELKPYDVLLGRFGPMLHDMPVLPFAIGVAMLGWLGVPGATAAHVVLLNKVFGSLGTALGMTPAAWAVTYLWGSKADTYGPFPNANMMSVLGFSESNRLKTLLSVGWVVLVPAALMYLLILIVLL